MARKTTITAEIVQDAVKALRADGKYIAIWPDGRVVGAALVKNRLGRGDYGTIQRVLADVLAAEAATPVLEEGEIVTDGALSERLRPLFDAITKTIAGFQAEAMRAAEARIALIEAGAAARIRAAEDARDRMAGQLVDAEQVQMLLEEAEKAISKVTKERDQALKALEEKKKDPEEPTEKPRTVELQPSNPSPVTAKPTDRQIAYARKLAHEHGVLLPVGVETDLKACKEFLDQYGSDRSVT